MEKEGFFDKVRSLKNRFKEFFQHRKQVAALNNYGFVKTFGENESSIFSSIKFCLKNDFLEDEDTEWIQKKLQKLQINYLDWCHKTKWVKAKMGSQERKEAARKPIQTTFDFVQQRAPIDIPVELIAAAQKNPYMRVS